ncbi:polysaccharide deacetylase family sporulation protein PdaB [Halalkalibacter sp. APA_J-10(15)]|uniref:polysaccharide deacetylase family sporulation protein PdaB n=1 Tax=unclassified Halalkalibacter TaxID=2893063 RepID=UPI001FF4C7B1|nr:polysaccharide deacetylase family sporulation protein PdaB [Halalkalibacter sp. APA_J-10(15)]MCK0473406.1 polysaccharide deacetylase family sporulation protein PdaB [Halalkalibacter sp. APA_J-10(15)]
MNFYWIVSAKKIKQLMLIILVAFFTASLVFVERNQISVFSTTDGPQAFYKAEIDKKQIALTFNISWGEEQLLPILEILDEKGIEQANFFVSASWAERYPELIEEIHKRGHSIGSHGYRYKDYVTWEQDKVRNDLNKSTQVLEELTGERPTLLRPPNGSFNKEVLSISDRAGYSTIHWSVNSNDYQNPGVEAIIQSVVPNTEPGDVILFHASDSVKQTHQALPIIIDQLQDAGFSFKTVEELMANTETQTEEIH